MGASASREKFAESVSALIERDVSPDDAEFWDELWKIPSSAEEVFELISADAARSLRDGRFDNLATLFTQATAQLCQIVETPYSIYFDQALNCTRVLTRILPFLLEKGDLGDADENVEHLCWGTGASPIPGDEKIGLVIGEQDIQNQGRTLSATSGNNWNVDPPQGGNGPLEQEQEPLALLVVHAAMHMLFLPQFTCDFYEDEMGGGADGQASSSQQQAPPPPPQLTEAQRKEQEQQQKEDRDRRTDAGLGQVKYMDTGIPLTPVPTSIIWAPGAGVTRDQLGFDGGTRKYDKNRTEVLRLLLAACCDPLFSPADEYNPLASRWLAVAVAADAPNNVCLFYSLLNTVLSYDPNGSGVPYSSTFASNNHVKLVELSAQVLCVLLDCGLPGSPQVVLNRTTSQPIVEFEVASQGGFNMIRTLLARMDSGRELTFVFRGFSRLLRNVYESKSKNSLLPNSAIRLECFQELMVLLWKFLEENPLFMSHILTQCNVNELITPICYLMYQSRRDPAQIGLVHICTFVLLKLSGERSFGVALGQPFLTKLPCDLPLFTGGHADLVAITLHKLIVNGAYKLVPLYSCFLTVIANISPYWRNMSLVSAVKMVNLFELFSSPKFLYSGEHAHRHLALLLEIFNNVIQYQYTGNHHLVYAIIRRKDSFGRLASLTLQKAQAQCFKVYGDHTSVKRDPDNSRTTSNTKDEAMSRAALAAGGQVDDDGSVSSSVDGQPFQPTAEWLEEVKATLPLETVTRLLQHLVPVVDDMVAKQQGVVDEKEILAVLADTTMVGLLPVPHAIVIRKYQPNQYTALWFTAFMWGVIFLRNQGMPMFDGETIELFQVAVQQDED